MASERPEEEELWLYGDSPICDEENSSTPRHDQSPDTLQNISTESTETNNVSLQVSQSESDDEENSDTDSDDDVMVTIGDIKTGASSCIGSAGNVKSGKGYNASGKLPPKGIDFSAPGCINGVPVLDADLDSFDDKPWRKPGADISDYFNYGFNEATWKVYCEKQRRLQMGLDPGYRSNCRENKITVLQGRMGGTTKGGENGDLNAVYVKEENSTVTSPSRKMEETTDVIGSVICNITTVQGRRWDSHDSEDISIQVLDDHAYKPPAPIHQQPPPPLLPPPPNMVPNPHPFHSIPPPHFFHRPPAATHLITPSLQPPALLPPPLLPPPSVHIPPVNGPPLSYNSRPHQRQNYNSTESHIISYQPPGSTTHSPWVTTVNKSTNSFSGNDWVSRRQRERETDRPRSLTTSNYKNEGDHYQHYHRERSYEQERKYQRSGERPREQGWEREEKPRGEHRTRDREESSKHKSSRHIQDSEERESREERESHESHKRHKRKKSKRGKEDKIKSEDKGEGSRRSHRD